jgi:hypothetical protein
MEQAEPHPRPAPVLRSETAVGREEHAVLAWLVSEVDLPGAVAGHLLDALQAWVPLRGTRLFGVEPVGGGHDVEGRPAGKGWQQVGDFQSPHFGGLESGSSAVAGLLPVDQRRFEIRIKVDAVGPALRRAKRPGGRRIRSSPDLRLRRSGLPSHERATRGHKGLAPSR